MKKHKFKNYITNFAELLKIILLFVMMGIGFLTVYSMIWIMVGLPSTWWAGALMVALATLTEYGYYRWIDG